MKARLQSPRVSTLGSRRGMASAGAVSWLGVATTAGSLTGEGDRVNNSVQGRRARRRTPNLADLAPPAGGKPARFATSRGREPARFATSRRRERTLRDEPATRTRTLATSRRPKASGAAPPGTAPRPSPPRGICCGGITLVHLLSRQQRRTTRAL